MLNNPGLRSTLLSLWLRLISLAIIGLVFAEALFLGRVRIQGWAFYLTPSEVVFEVAVRLVFGALVGIALSTLCTALLTPFLFCFNTGRERISQWTTKIAVVLVLFLDSRYALTSLIKWSNRGVRFTSALLIAHFLFFVVALCIPRLREEVVSSLDGFLGAKMTRGIAWATITATVALVGMEFVLSQSKHTVKAAAISQHPKSNILLITFDALSAEDMSLYGYQLPTTPNIDAFARNATVFTNFYSGSTFTTPSIGVILTGGYPSESRVYGLAGQVPAANAEKSLPHELRAGGYSTGAFLTNPWAYYLSNSLEDGFEVLPEPTFHPGGFQYLWDATRILHQDSRIGSRITEYFDLEMSWGLLNGIPNSLSFRYRPDASFRQPEQMLADMPDGFFLWIHVLAPHHPYLPDAADQGRFLPQDELLSYENEDWTHWKPFYEIDEQRQVDRHRLAYNEYLLSADRAFGDFIAELEKKGKLGNTTVILSADHGESFEGGIYQHQTPYLTRPVIHIPLIIKKPGQHGGRKVSFTADQTALAPTILDLAGLPRPEWMHGQSLATWLNRDDQDPGQGLAFTQYLERNSTFEPLHHGMVGVIDGQYQYVLDLGTQKGALRSLDQAHFWDLDRTAENPARAEALRAEIYARFPEVRRSLVSQQ